MSREKVESYHWNRFEKKYFLICLTSSVFTGGVAFVVAASASPPSVLTPLTTAFIATLLSLGWALFLMLGVYWFLQLHPDVKKRVDEQAAKDVATHQKYLRFLHLKK
jgi:hypothetical protein